MVYIQGLHTTEHTLVNVIRQDKLYHFLHITQHTYLMCVKSCSFCRTYNVFIWWTIKLQHSHIRNSTKTQEYERLGCSLCFRYIIPFRFRTPASVMSRVRAPMLLTTRVSETGHSSWRATDLVRSLERSVVRSSYSSRNSLTDVD